MADGSSAAALGAAAPAAAAPAAADPNAAAAINVAPVTDTTTVTNPAAPAATETIDWLKGAPETDVGYVKNKGWQSPADVLNAYRGAEKFISAPVDQRLVIPGEKAEKAEWDNFYAKLGRPAAPTDYKLPVPEGDKGEFAKTAASWFHELGLSSKQAEGVASKWNEHLANAAATEASARQTSFTGDEAKLKTEWGAAYDKNVMIAKEVVGKVGLDAKTIDALQGAIGHHGVMNLLVKLGSGLGEDTFVTGRDNGSSFGNAMTPAQAKAEIAALQNDRTFTQAYLKGGKAEMEKMKTLMGYAYPEQAA